MMKWWTWRDSNPRPLTSHDSTLPLSYTSVGRRGGNRTLDSRSSDGGGYKAPAWTTSAPKIWRPLPSATRLPSAARPRQCALTPFGAKIGPTGKNRTSCTACIRRRPRTTSGRMGRMTGIEPACPGPQPGRHANGVHPTQIGVPGGIRTRSLRLRRSPLIRLSFQDRNGRDDRNRTCLLWFPKPAINH